MELKKSPKADLQNKRSYFLQLGLVLSLVLTIVLFGWSQSEQKIDTFANDAVAAEEELMEVTVQEDQPKPEPVKVQQVTISDMLNIVRDDQKIEQDLSIFDIDVTQEVQMTTRQFKVEKEEAVDEETPVLVAEEMPTFMGKDINEFRSWCQAKIKYPQIAQDNGIQGRVTLQFVVERDGKVSNVKVLRGTDKELDAAAVKQIMSSPAWKPGKNRGKPVRVTYTIPIEFKLQ